MPDGGVAGLIQSGGFGSFSKRYGTAAASLIEAEIVGADGHVRIANACTHPDLFWAIKGGGGGSFGAVTRLTLATHDLPDFFGGVFTTISATSDVAFRRLIGKAMAFYRDRLFNPHWGEQIAFRPNNSLIVGMTFQGLDQQGAEALWRPFLDEIGASPQDFRIESAPVIVALPAPRFWDPTLLGDFVLTDDRPGAPASNIFWAGNLEESGQVLHGYQSVWMPAALLQKDAEAKLADALFAASRHWGVSLHFNKGLAGAPASALAASGDTATNPAALDAFALLISGAEGPPAYPGIAGREPDVATARREAQAINQAMKEIKTRLGATGSYLAESNFFEDTWQDAFWGNHAGRLDAVKAKYDPDDLFIVHHGVGSQRWSTDGFRRLE